MVQWIKVLATKTDDPSSIPRTHVDGENKCHNLYSGFNMDAMAHECTPPINKCNTNLRRITWKDGYESHQGVHHTERSIQNQLNEF